MNQACREVQHMKYYTKQRYMELQAQELMRHLQADKNAAEFSEEYFSETYAAEEKQYIQQGYDFKKQEGLSYEEAAKQRFRASYEYELRMFEEHLTDEIKEKVADMRMLTLERATPEVVSAAKTLADELYARIRLQKYNYTQVFNKNFPFKSSCPLSDYLHDSTVTAFDSSSKDVVISVKTPTLISQHKQLRFKNADVLHSDGDITGCIWIDSEIYPVKKGYEIHILLLKVDEHTYNIDMALELTFTCSNVQIKDIKTKPVQIIEAD